MIGIYKILNNITGDFYIGSSCNLKQRKNTHFRSLRKGTHHSIILQRAVNKYGIDNFIFEIIENCKKEKQVSYADFFWKPGIARNYIYGYKLAQKIIGRDENHSYNVLDEFLREWNEITKMNPEHLWIDGSEFGLYGIKFIVENKGKLKITTSLIEDYSREEFNLNCLIIKI